MRFPRNIKPLRGPIDMVPLVNVFFLLLIFVLMTALVYTPGIPIHLTENVNGSPQAKGLINVARNGTISFENKTYNLERLEQLRAEIAKLPAQSSIVIKAENDAPRELVLRLRECAKEIPLNVEILGVGIELPTGSNLLGTANRTVVVSVNLGGQFFYENEVIKEADLKSKLKRLADSSKSPLTLVVLADKSMSNEIMAQLYRVALDAGIKDMLLPTRILP